MKVLVTGGLGFIGGHFVDHCLAYGDEVMIIDCMTYAANKPLFDEFIAKNVRISVSSITSYEDNVVALARFRPDVVVNFAAETHVDNSIQDCSKFISTNVIGTSALINACKEFNTKICHISTDEVYGPALDRPYSEVDRLNPMNPYSATKASAEMLIQSFQNTYNLNAMIIRPSNNYGPRQNFEKFIPKLMLSVLFGQKFPLYGDGLHEREWTFVKDTARLVRNAILAEKRWDLRSIYNLSSGIFYKNVDVIHTFLDIINTKFERNISLEKVVEYVPDRLGHDRRYSISSEKLSKITNLEFTPFNIGIITTLESML